MARLLPSQEITLSPVTTRRQPLRQRDDEERGDAETRCCPGASGAMAAPRASGAPPSVVACPEVRANHMRLPYVFTICVDSLKYRAAGAHADRRHQPPTENAFTIVAAPRRDASAVL